MRSELEMLEIIKSGNYSVWINDVNLESANIIKNKIQEIPSTFFEPRISVDLDASNNISLIDFMMQTVGMSTEKREGLMTQYHISHYDVIKLQTIINSIKVASEYGVEREIKKENKNDSSYGIALSDEKALDKAYPLWIAYLYSDSKTPYEDIKIRLAHDGTDDKYTPEYIVGLIEHTNSILSEKSISEKKDFFISTINGILEEGFGINLSSKAEIDI